ncbi:MAG: hypothetical protein ABH840_00690 [Nanoarchaeota archaeon]
MSKDKTIEELTNLLAVALRHKIGSIVNSNEIYAQKYSKDAEVLLKEAKKTASSINWNEYDKAKIKERLKVKLNEELRKKDFLDSRKFEIMDEEMENALKELELD